MSTKMLPSKPLPPQVDGSLFKHYTDQRVVVNGHVHPDEVMEVIRTILVSKAINFKVYANMYQIVCNGSNEATEDSEPMGKPNFCSGEPFEFDLNLALDGSNVVVFFTNHTHNSVKCNDVARDLRNTFNLYEDR